MTLTPDQKAHATQLIASGKQLEAVRYFREVLGIDANQALALAEKLEQEMGGPTGALAHRVATHLRSGASVGRLVGRIFMTVGLILASVGAYFIYSNIQFKQHATPIKGTLVEYESYVSTSDNSSTTMYTPVFEYRFNGKTYTHVNTSSSNYQEFEIGETVDILVDPEHPENVLIESFMEEWFVSLILGIMGAFFAGMGYVAYRVVGSSR